MNFKKIFVSLMLTGAVTPGAYAQDNPESSSATPILPPPAPAPSPPPPPSKNWGPAPEPDTAAASMPKKEAKKLRRQRRADFQICNNRSELKLWMLENMLAACDRLLGLPLGEKDAWDTRAQILQQRALVLINLGDVNSAKSAIEKSQAIGSEKNDPLFDGGTGVSNSLLRAFILNKQGKKEAAVELLDEIRKSRPYATSILQVADSMETSFNGDIKTLVERQLARLKFDPDVQRSLIFLHLIEGDLEKAAAVGNQVSLVDPKLRGSWSMVGGPTEGDKLRQRVAFDGTRAYIAAAMGKDDLAMQRFAGAKAAITEFIGSAPTKSRSGKISKSKVRKYKERQSSGAAVQKMIDEWQDAVELRASLEGKSVETVLAQLGGYQNKTELFPVAIDVLRQMGKSEANDAPAAKVMADAIIGRGLLDALKVKPGKLGPMLPKNQNLNQISKFDSNANDWLWGGNSGYTQTKEKAGDDDIRTIRFEARFGTRALVEERLMMAIASFAARDGYDGFMILSNRTIARQITTTGMYIGSSTTNAGFEAQARVKMLRTAELEPGSTENDRAINAAKIVQDLQPRYENYMARKLAIREAKKRARR